MVVGVNGLVDQVDSIVVGAMGRKWCLIRAMGRVMGD
jgi:hypothetical protein